MYDDPILSKRSKNWVALMNLLFPIFTYMTSIPVATIIVRLNFLSSHLFRKG